MTNTARAVAPIDQRILDEAADWVVQLHASTATEADRAACERWQRRDPEHARAWARVELLLDKLGSLPARAALPALDLPRSAGRRAAARKIAVLLAAVPAGFAAWRVAEWQAWTADHQTASGEQREVGLPDGTRLTLNTATAIDVRFDAMQRLVHLRHGEVMVETAPDTSPTHRPFRVETPHGRLEAIGTRFNTRLDGGETRLLVLEGRVRVEPRHAMPGSTQVLEAGQQTTFTTHTIAAAWAAGPSATAWTHGMLLADRMRLADFAAELARYHPGIVRCDPAIADLRVSGAFPVMDRGRTLSMLAATYPMDVLTRFGGLWVTFSPH